ncbi:MAG TPA: phage major capsid protein [Patescibacteria group bacterium]|nr:phage major capsid protein [Patescibacteria group bacterium]
MEKSLIPTMEEVSVKNARKVVEQMLIERSVKGRDVSALDSERKIAFAKQVQAVYRGFREGALKVKANEALIEEQDNRGGYLVEPEVADAILRIAASVGTIMKQCQKWPMKTDELGIPNYTGSFLTGSYVGVDLPGTVTGLTFGQAVLIARKWQLAFTVGNDLLADASVQLADWLLAMAGEALANMIDQQGFIGGTATTAPGPFVGILNAANTQTYTLASGTTYASFDVIKDSSAMIGLLEESILEGAAFYMHRTVWAALRTQEGSNGLPVLLFGGLASPATLDIDPTGGPIRPAGSILGFPVYTNRWLPTNTASSQAGTAFLIFGNMKAAAFGDKGDMRVAQFESGSFGGKEIALSDQRGIVYKHRHAFVVVLPQAFVVCKTHA